MAKTLHVLYGSESGNTEKLASSVELTAKEIAKDLKFEVIKKNLKDVKVADLAGIENLVLLISTWGEGDPPGSAEKFCKELYSASSPSLASANYTVLAMGDKGYTDFCGCGRKVDESLAKLGAKAIMPRQDYDLDYAAHFEKWEIELFTKLAPMLKE